MRQFLVPSLALAAAGVLAVSSVLAAPLILRHQGKAYYVVSGNNRAFDTGTEVCRSVGKTCVGYTANTTALCRQLHPTAKAVTTIQGSKSGFYCDGRPQTGVCSTTKNSCLVCPTCKVNAGCDTEIGSQFKEMYVECADIAPPMIRTKSSSSIWRPNPRLPRY